MKDASTTLIGAVFVLTLLTSCSTKVVLPDDDLPAIEYNNRVEDISVRLERPKLCEETRGYVREGYNYSEVINHSETVRDCYRWHAIRRNQSELCSFIQDNGSRAECTLRVKTYQEDLSYEACEQVKVIAGENSPHVLECVMRVVAEAEQSTACDLLDNTTRTNACQRVASANLTEDQKDKLYLGLSFT